MNETYVKATFPIIVLLRVTAQLFFFNFFGFKNLICSFELSFAPELSFHFTTHPPTIVHLSLTFATGHAAYTLKTINSLSCQFCIICENCSPFLCSYLNTLGSVIHLFSLGVKIT